MGDAMLKSDALPAGIISMAYLSQRNYYMSWRNGQFSMRRLVACSVAAIGLMLVILTPTVANAATAKVAKPDGSLTASWWEKFVGVTDPETFRGCDVGTGKIVFLTGTTGDPSTDNNRSCTTDKAKTFLVPLINVECSTAEGNGETFAQLAECAKVIADDFTDLKLEIDGQPVGNLNELRVQAESTFTPVEGNVFPTIPPFTNSKFATDGYWALIKLTPGDHTLSFGGSYPPGSFTTEVTYQLTVKK
jgi:hypothetical protein